MRQLKDDGRLLGFFVNEFSSLEKVVVIKAVALILEQRSIGGQDEHLLARPVLARLPESLILIRHDQVIVSVMLTGVRLPFLVFFELHVRQRLCQVEMYLVNILDCIRKLRNFVL